MLPARARTAPRAVGERGAPPGETRDAGRAAEADIAKADMVVWDVRAGFSSERSGSSRDRAARPRRARARGAPGKEAGGGRREGL